MFVFVIASIVRIATKKVIVFSLNFLIYLFEKGQYSNFSKDFNVSRFDVL